MLKEGMIVNFEGGSVEIVKHIGKGKGGNSYLAKFEGENVVFKKMHYEPCDTYTFEKNKLNSEIRDYNHLKEIGIKLPSLLLYNDKEQFLIKDYVDGKTISQIVAESRMKDSYIVQMFQMCRLLYANNLNIDYFPTNFVIENDILYYIDFECNGYMQEWDFESWGIYFWANSAGMAKFLKSGDHKYLSINAKPHKEGLEETVSKFLSLKSQS